MPKSWHLRRQGQRFFFGPSSQLLKRIPLALFALLAAVAILSSPILSWERRAEALLQQTAVLSEEDRLRYRQNVPHISEEEMRRLKFIEDKAQRSVNEGYAQAHASSAREEYLRNAPTTGKHNP